MPRRLAVSVQPPPADLPSGNLWLVARYDPVCLFSLRMSTATSKGGKTLPVPTPYAVKMALIDACFRRFPAAEALVQARAVFSEISARWVRICPPRHCVVNNTFQKVLDHDREGPAPFRATIAYREFACFSGDLLLAISADGLSVDQGRLLSELFAHITSIGKRGGIVQFIGCESINGELPQGFTVPRNEANIEQIAGYASTAALDDFGPALCTARDGFDRISTYGSGTVRLGEHRTLTLTAIPYSRRSAGRHYTWYENVFAEVRPV